MSNSLVYGRGNIDERTVTICSGIDFVQISHTNITGADPPTTKVGLARFVAVSNELSPVFALGMDRRTEKNHTQS